MIEEIYFSNNNNLSKHFLYEVTPNYLMNGN